MKRILIFIALSMVLSGCEAYNRSGWWTPDTFNYTYATDGHSLPTHYVGLSWTIKDKP